jgi:uncharacterized protein YbaR (Trm112 family)
VLAAELVAMLRCPETGAPLHYFPDADGLPGFGPGFLFCAESRLKYPIDELDYPVLLREEAVRATDDEVAALTAQLSRTPSGS